MAKIDNNELYLDRVDSYLRGIDIAEQHTEDVAEDLLDIFLDVHDTKLISSLITNEEGYITAPGIVIDKSNKKHVALFELNIYADKVVNDITLVEPDMGYITIDSYEDYLGAWAEDAFPYTYEIYVDVLE